MKNVRWCIIAIVNFLMLGWLLKVFLFDPVDGAGVFVIFGLAFIAIYNVYMLIVSALFSEVIGRSVFVEGFFSIVIVLPLVLLHFLRL
jgi:hypothetical protein